MRKNYDLYSPYQRTIDNLKRRIRGYEKMKKDLTNQYRKSNKENQELKKQLEVGKEQYNDLVEEKENLQEQLSSNILQFENRQKEFIEWLENLIGQNETVIEVSKYGLPKECSKLLIDFYKSILSKYKEIVGGSNENRRN